jgi:hypothetical protein
MMKLCSLLLVCVLLVTMVACSVDQVLSDIDVALQMASAIGVAVGNVSPGDAAIIQNLASIGTTGLLAIQAFYDTYRKDPTATNLQKLQAAIDALKTNLPQELAAAHITNPNTVAQVTAWVNLTVSLLDAVLTHLPALKLEKRGGAMSIDLPTPDSLQSRWASEICHGDAACAKLVKARKVRR